MSSESAVKLHDQDVAKYCKLINELRSRVQSLLWQRWRDCFFFFLVIVFIFNIFLPKTHGSNNLHSQHTPGSKYHLFIDPSCKNNTDENGAAPLTHWETKPTVDSCPASNQGLHFNIFCLTETWLIPLVPDQVKCPTNSLSAYRTGESGK